MQRHEFLGALETYPPKCGGQRDDGSGVCTAGEQDHREPSHYRVLSKIPYGGVIVLDENSRMARLALVSDSPHVKKLGRAGEDLYADDVIWKFGESPAVWKFKDFAQTHVYTPLAGVVGCAGPKDAGQGMCGMSERLHARLAIPTEKSPYVGIETRRLAKNLRQDMEAAQRMAGQYQRWARLKDSTEENRNICRQHSQVWQARAHALMLALSGLE